MADLPYFKFFVADYNAATDWASLEIDGMYCRTLRLMWLTDGCSIPNDEKWIKRKLRITDTEYNDIFLVVKDDFLKTKKGRIYQKRLLDEYNDAKKTKKSLSDAGKKGVRAKALKNKDKDVNPAKATLKPPSPKKQATLKHVIVTDTVIEEPPTPLEGGIMHEDEPNITVETHRGSNLVGEKAKDFLLFWEAFDYKNGKAQAASSWANIKNYNVALVEQIISAARETAKNRNPEKLTPKMAQGWLTAMRWQDESQKNKSSADNPYQDFPDLD